MRRTEGNRTHEIVGTELEQTPKRQDGADMAYNSTETDGGDVGGLHEERNQVVDVSYLDIEDKKSLYYIDVIM